MTSRSSSSRWLREALKWQLKTALETGLLRWASVLARLGSLTIFSQFIAERGIDEPRLCADRAELRLLALDFLAHVKQRRARCGANRGELVTNGTVRHTINHVERFYAFMADYKEEAARALGEPRWEALGDQHARLWRPGEKPLPPRLPDEDVYFDDHTMAQVMRHAGLLGAPPEEGGIGDEQAMRILMLLARTGRRAGELLLLDFDCLLPIAGIPAAEHDTSPDAIVAKLRFQQTKIEGAPNTIFVDSEVVAIVRAQQQWVHDHVRALLRDPDAPPPRYLFLAITRNHLGRHSYPKTTVTRRLKQLGELADIRDSQGRRPPLSNVHRFRHTRATSLINAGVPVHVVQRYLGHLSAEMTMRYAHTLRETHEREFLRYKKITADGADLDLDPRDLFALIELGKRTDRVLPNGLCMLPPRQTCNRGNACLTCDKFTTDASYLPEHEQQLEKLSELIAQRQAAFRARTGEEMTGSNVWLEQRLTEQRALEKIITVLRAARARRAPRPGRARRGHQRPRRQPARHRSNTEMARGNPDNLRAAAQRKRQAATERAQTALDALDRRRRADHLPRPREDRGRVDRLPIPLAAARPRRAAPRRAATHAARPRNRDPEPNEPPSQSNVVRALTAQITELKQRHRAETEHLQAALAAAHGENLELRRQLGRQRRTPAA